MKINEDPEFGDETFQVAAEIAVKEVKHRLENKVSYMGHGTCLREGLWK